MLAPPSPPREDPMTFRDAGKGIDRLRREVVTFSPGDQACVFLRKDGGREVEGINMWGVSQVCVLIGQQIS